MNKANHPTLAKLIALKINQLEILNKTSITEQDWQKIEEYSISESENASILNINESSLSDQTLHTYYILLEKKYLLKLKSAQDHLRAEFISR